ncbi:hypothetical protein GN958_ATG07623 [Phytophthora infestans]|uniref:Uncharacterized protein n=1 Tax=Phytophthora infestans TaxID=4787 RepID=A0A8S9UVG9_PHYIN|nr:hypothetical protein GN958_ATG07623 [Phytophthora infestans]
MVWLRMVSAVDGYTASSMSYEYVAGGRVTCLGDGLLGTKFGLGSRAGSTLSFASQAFSSIDMDVVSVSFLLSLITYTKLVIRTDQAA